jgi:drug/metabolite transporter (DMT)-like permease
VIAVLGGLGAAVAWAGATLCSSRSARLIGAPSVLAWVMIVGLLVVGGPAAAQGRPAGLDGEAWAWLTISGAGNVAGLLLSYAALRVGKVGIVAPITSTEGAIAAVIAVVAGEHLGPASAAMLAVVAVGVVLTGLHRDPEPTGNPRRSVTLAVIGALCFGASLYSTGRVSESLPIVWALLPARVIGVIAVALPLAASGRLRIVRAAVPFVVAGGLCEVLGFGSFAIGARHGIAVSAVLASQFAAVAVVAAYFLFGERLERAQVAGVTAIAAGVAVLTALQAG